MLKHSHILLKSLKNTINHKLLRSVAAIFPGLDTPSDTEPHYRTACANAMASCSLPLPPTDQQAQLNDKLIRHLYMSHGCWKGQYENLVKWV